MKITRFSTAIAFASLIILLLVSNLFAQAHKDKLDKAHQRLKAVYDEKVFNPRPFSPKWLADSTGFTITDKDSESKPNKEKEDMYLFDLTGKISPVDDPNTVKHYSKDYKTSPDGKYEAYSKKSNLHVREISTDKSTPLTTTASNGNIFYTIKGFSPDSQMIAFVQSDYSNVKKRNMLIPGDPSYPGHRSVHFARVGGIIPSLRVGVVDILARQTQWVSIPQPSEGFYLGQVSWAGNSHELLIEYLNRFRTERKFILADIRTGKLTTIFHESSESWVVASYGKNLGLQWIDDHKKFIVLTEKDGYRHAYLYSRDGKELALLTPGNFDIIEKSVIDEDAGCFYYYASPNNGTQKYLYSVKLNASEKPQLLTPKDQPGTHTYNFSPDKKYAIHSYSTFDTPPVIELLKMPDRKVISTLEDNKKLRSKMKSFGSMTTEFPKIEIDGGIEMDALMVKPADFDPSKKYPVFIYVYGEPHGQTVYDKWSSGMHMFHRIISEMGYLVVSIDNQGTPAPKGAAWRRTIFGSLGPLSTEQQAAGIQKLGKMHPYVDLSRVGIWGWSGGGSNTLNALFRKPDVYHCGIAVVPKPQPHLYNAWFQEIYMQTPEVNPDGYKLSAPINYAQGLKGDLLIITGTGETNTHIQIIEGLVDKMIEMGKQFDYTAYPNLDHGLRESKGAQTHVRMLIARYLIDHLQPGPK